MMYMTVLTSNMNMLSTDMITFQFVRLDFVSMLRFCIDNRQVRTIGSIRAALRWVGSSHMRRGSR
jgi:hypothetical protein